jgi:hypothetical protein
VKIEDNSQLIGYGIAGLILLWILYHTWFLAVGILAIWGAHCLIQEWRRNNRDE